MFNLFHKNGDSLVEVLPENEIYIVYELYEYEFTYKENIVTGTVFIEDEVFNQDLIAVSETQICMNKPARIFEDYFGYLSLKVDQHSYRFEVRVRKLKVPELEAIMVYLWNQDPIIFNNFFSKSTVKSKLSKENQFTDFSSKFVNVFEDFYHFFKRQYLIFKSLPHYVLRGDASIMPYNDAEISLSSIEWLLHNMDNISIDPLFRNSENAVRLGNSFGIVENILSEVKSQDFNVYENQIIIGTFQFVINQIQSIKTKLERLIPVKPAYNKEFFSINELKVLPFLKLKDDISKTESKIRILEKKYVALFENPYPLNANPRLTAVFAKKKHYSDAYSSIRLIRDIHFSLDGELSLLNIRKVSTLYERYNLFVLINYLNSKTPNKFTKGAISPDNIYKEYRFDFGSKIITLFYDYTVQSFDSETGLRRISEGGNYRPDFIIRLDEGRSRKFFVLDSKYSKETTVLYRHLPSCINKYILDMGITDDPNKKVDLLIMLYPGEQDQIVYGNSVFRPQIGILASKINKNSIAQLLDVELGFDL